MGTIDGRSAFATWRERQRQNDFDGIGPYHRDAKQQQDDEHTELQLFRWRFGYLIWLKD